MRLTMMALVVRDYDEAIAFYVNVLGFALLEDTDRGGGKRWVRVRPAGGGTEFLLAKAVTPAQSGVVGNQTGGRVFLFVETADFDGEYARLKARGVKFAREASVEDFGKVAVFEDLYGNKFDLIQRH